MQLIIIAKFIGKQLMHEIKLTVWEYKRLILEPKQTELGII